MSATLTVRFDSASQLLKTLLRAEVRDGALRLVGTAQHGMPLRLAPGLYRIDAVLDDGTALQRVVVLDEGQQEQITLVKARQPVAASPSRSAVDEGYESMLPEAPAIGIPAAHDGAHPLDLSTVDGARATHVAPGHWSFRTDDRGAATAVFANATRRWTISLPVLTGGQVSSAQPDECTVRIEGPAHARMPVARIASWRTVASSVQEMLLQFRIEQVLAIADEATTALAAKYSDPAGAALGALLLYRVDRLAPLRSWLDNLARSFPWLVDARILQAGLAARSSDTAQRARGLELLLDGTTERALFTESHSLRLHLLRRWPDEARSAERDAALDASADRYPNVDWSALTLTTSQTIA